MIESTKGKHRIENLSDLVFGLALSLGSITLFSNAVKDPASLVTNILLFGFSFIIVIWIWSGYTRTMGVMPFENRRTFVLNIALLFCVAIEPYLFYVLFRAPLSLLDFASSLYAVDAGAMMFILAGLGYMALLEERRRPRHNPAFDPAKFGRIVRAEVTSGLVFFASALPFLWVSTTIGSFDSFLRFDLWYAVFLVFFIVTRLGEQSSNEPSAGQVT